MREVSMKITGPGTINEVYNTRRSPNQAQGDTQRASAPAAQVEVSQDASWIESLKAELGETPGVRADVVNEVKAQLANGSFESSMDLEAVLDGLLADY
jgi:flagellar biosynthesis anti-sigma factor FlgM